MAEPRPAVDEYKMTLAVEIASRSNCLKAHVGVILVQDDRIRCVGYNGTVEGYPNCFDGGCPRCRDFRIKRGAQLDRCVCVHAEENALISAARYGIEVAATECFVTHEPCVGCTKLLIQAHIARVVFLSDYEHPATSDLNESRRSMRDRPESPQFRKFRDIVPEQRRTEMDNRIELWTRRLEEMKLAAERHARGAGLVIES